MYDPSTIREVQAEAERRMTGGPDPVAAFDLLPPDARQRIEDDPRADVTGAIESLWSTWLDLTVKLQAIGFPARTLCDASNTVAETWEKADTGAREHA